MTQGHAAEMGLPFNPEYGLVVVFCVVLVQQLGAPLPVLPVMLFAGAQSARDPFYGIYALALAIVASTLGSLPWFLAGQRFGHRVLKFSCKASLSPDTCVRQTETVFERHGAVTLLISKFVPGLAHVTPPLAGAFGFGMPSFLFFNAVGAVLWAGAGLILGLLFYAEINSLLRQFVGFGGHALAALALLVVTYVAYRWSVRRRFLKSLQASRIEVAELQEMIGRGDAPIVLDVRSRTHRKLDGRMIPGAQPVDLDDLERPLAQISADRDVVVYCACPNDATAVKVAMLLKRRGIRRVRSLAGGIDAWTSAGLTTEGQPRS
jgi:membrane protein DedA with SNARE-associated domain/rhodanese-related sulfurtransferase